MKKRTIMMIRKRRKRCKRNDGKSLVINYKKYDVVVGMYHDQVLAPFKTLFHFDAINITLGLNYLRVSPDHGPAIDLIGKNKANYLSLFQCIKFINNIN